ncbi:MAG: phosphoadenylyl-sulfate reductase [Firmicutes bacterium]|nr:phosphoadenylyl-sulfate reductase [Bacillota bacterium]
MAAEEQFPPGELAAVAQRLEAAGPEATLRWAAETLGPDRVAVACSFGAEDMVLVDLWSRVNPGGQVFYLDTGLLFPETYGTRDRLLARYPVTVTRYAPRISLEEQAEEYGDELWNRDPDRCCGLRKVEPLARALRGLRGWVTGIRREQAPTRASAQVVEWDHRHGLVKVNPLAAWTWDQVWAYIREHGVPYNPLHDRGYPSIGCRPCTRPVTPGEDLRAGRWPGFAKTECGLHR